MTVYELIKELAQYNADDEIEFHIKEKYYADVEAEFDRENEDDTQEVTVDVEYDGARQNYWDKHKVVIDLKY